MTRWPETWALAAVLASRGALAAILGPGRDEVAYAWWAWNGLDASYSLVVGALVRASTALLGDGAFAMRLPGLLAGLAAVAATIAMTRALGARTRTAIGAGLAIAASPWQGYAGTVVHPDALLLPAALGVTAGLVAAGRRVAARAAAAGRPLPLAAAAAAVGAFTKLSGIVLFLPVALGAIAAWRRGARRSVGAAAAILFGAGAVLLAARDPGVITGLRELGRFDPSLPAAGRIPWSIAEVALLAGPALLIAATLGVAAARRRGPEGAAARTALSIALSIGAAFAAFALAGQAKGNWFLPGLAVLVPFGAREAERRGGAGRLAAWGVASAAGTMALGLVWALPTRPAAWEAFRGAPIVRAVDATYAAHAGPRERAVSPTRTWTERLAEYGPPPPLDPRVAAAFDEGAVAIVSNDYGLAFRIARNLGRRTRVLLPEDPLFRRTCGGDLRPGEDAVWVTRHGAGPPAAWRKRFREVRIVPDPPPAPPGAPATPAPPAGLRVFRLIDRLDEGETDANVP